MLKFSKKNSKMLHLAQMLGLKESQVVSFDLPAGFTCPATFLCRAFSDKRTGKMTKGKGAQFTCYAAKIEAAYPSVRRAHWHNFETLRPILRDVDKMVALIDASLPKGIKVVRIHSSGDFCTEEYFRAWTVIASLYPEITFFTYTKVLPYMRIETPDNFHITYSMGGKWDEAYTNTIPSCTVVKNEAQAEEIGRPVACRTVTEPDDFTFIVDGKSFAICLH
jgi:hypothetical protein